MDKEEIEYEETNAYPTIGMLDHIEIQGKETSIRIGGFCIGGFYLEEPYILKEKKGNNIFSKDVTYYTIIKDKKLKSEREKKIREHRENQKKEEKKWLKDSLKDAKESVENYTKRLEETKNEKAN